MKTALQKLVILLAILLASWLALGCEKMHSPTEDIEKCQAPGLYGPCCTPGTDGDACQLQLPTGEKPTDQLVCDQSTNWCWRVK